MGSVYAKSLLEEEQMKIGENKISLDKIKARVDKVHVDGVGRTKDDILAKAVKGLFQAHNFEEVLLTAQDVKQQLEILGAFKHIGIYIDTSKGPEASPDGVEVTFHTVEVRRVVGGVNTLVGNNEGSMVIGLKLPNLGGRGENIQTEYQYGTKRSYGFNATVTKPYIFRGNPRITGAIFQHAADFPWSGFRQIDRGTLLEVAFESAPQVHHSFRWEGIWRELKCALPSTAFAVREETGHSLKSSIKHILTRDTRDNPVLPSAGTFLRLNQELAGLGGDIGFFKQEFEFQFNQNLGYDMILQGSLMGGFMKRMSLDKSFNIADRLFLGGPLSLRGFTMRGVGPCDEDNALGAESYWATGLHLYTPLPFKPAKGGIGELFKTHFFLNVGNIGNFQFSNDYHQNLIMLLTNLRVACGAGIVLSVGHVARFELNYCVPVKYQPGDKLNPGLQFGVGVTFL
ncbi:sorting and assembly machinery component 50 homolog A isoform X2 [Tachypleus tridentatus]|uniref:sorting and assembly machinery component 50 homolog A isoform X2 n=1 Tax=Tachypleus tridentatus TaxID=6853 RepID=UPI003FD5A617